MTYNLKQQKVLKYINDFLKEIPFDGTFEVITKNAKLPTILITHSNEKQYELLFENLYLEDYLLNHKVRYALSLFIPKQIINTQFWLNSSIWLTDKRPFFLIIMYLLFKPVFEIYGFNTHVIYDQTDYIRKFIFTFNNTPKSHNYSHKEKAELHYYYNSDCEYSSKNKASYAISLDSHCMQSKHKDKNNVTKYLVTSLLLLTDPILYFKLYEKNVVSHCKYKKHYSKTKWMSEHIKTTIAENDSKLLFKYLVLKEIFGDLCNDLVNVIINYYLFIDSFFG